ncbi:transposase [Paenibacillus phocaensis]|uniref:transposase n=1 Tax=Paenibacillus phocaensis TaxID=1776378 RepID=UPI000839D08B|nr:transposase [Paenibacillus phocaensis]
METTAEMIHHPIGQRYTSEQDCMNALIAMKWPTGFVCPRCAHTRCSHLSSRRVPLFECASCGHQTSPMVGTMFEGTHLPLMKWFQALELFLLPDGISATRLSKEIQVTYKTAWLMLHKIRHSVGEFDAKELLSGEVKVNCDQYGANPARPQFPNPYATAVVAGCTVTESGELEHIKLRLLPHKRGNGERGNQRDLVTFINRNVEVRTSMVQSFPLAFRLYLPLRKVVREAWGSLTRTYVSLGLKYLQAYLNEYTVRRKLSVRPGTDLAMRQELLRICMAIPAIPYRQLIARQPNPQLPVAA